MTPPNTVEDAFSQGIVLSNELTLDALQRLQPRGVSKAAIDRWPEIWRQPNGAPPVAPFCSAVQGTFELWQAILGALEDYEVRENLKRRTKWDDVWRGARTDAEWRAALCTVALLNLAQNSGRIAQHRLFAYSFGLRGKAHAPVLAWLRKNLPRRYQRVEEDA